MESGTDSASSVLIPVTEYSETFKRKILAPLQSAYLYDESKLSFRYKSASLVKNASLTKKYAAFRAKKRQAGYSEDDLEETHGFLLFDDVTKAIAFGQTGVVTGTSACTSLGDPLKGVYISMFSDCLGPERWRDGQSGYIAIIRLTTGKVKRVSATQTRDLGTPTVGFDCHVSQHLASVTTQTSFSLAFERTQCYIYELLDDGSNETASTPSLMCPFAIVAFSYKKRRALAMKEPKPCGFISYEILRFLPVLHLAEGEVKKTNPDPNKGMCNIVANGAQTYAVLINPGPARSPSLAPTTHDGGGSLSSSEAVPAGAPQTGSKVQMIVEKTPAEFETNTGDARDDLSGPNKTHNHEMKTLKAPDVPAELIVSFTSEQSVTERSPVSPVPTEYFSAKRGRLTDCPEFPRLTKKQQRKALQKHSKTKKEASKPSFETPRPQKQNSEADRLSSQAEQNTAQSNIDWEKLRRWVMKGRHGRTRTVDSNKADKTEKPILSGTNVIDLQAPLRDKSERWNLKPVLSECGRVLVPHGLRDLPEPLKETASVQQFPSPNIDPNAAEIEHRPGVFAAPPARRMEVMESKTGSPDRNAVQDSRDREDPVQPTGVHEHTGPTHHDQSAGKREPTCILSRRKTSKHRLNLDESPQDLTVEKGPSLKRNRVDGNVIRIPAGAAVGIEEDSTVHSVNPKETTNTKARRRLDDAQKRGGKKAQIISRPPSIYPKWNSMKMLRKHIDISRERFKKTWWMHVQPPSRASQTVKQRARVYSLRKKMPTSNPSTDALNLLADLALGATSERLPAHKDRQVERQPQPALRKNDDPIDVGGAAEVSVLHTLLGQPVTRLASSQSPLVKGLELVSLLCKEHAYSLPLSAAIPSGLPGTPFPVSPLSGSNGLLHRPHDNQTPQKSDDLEDAPCVPSDHPVKWTNLFKRCRSFVYKGESVQVTRQWKEKYDFNRDSRFSRDPKNRTIIRALHGPWDFSSQDTSEDKELIVHMWISFFYSRSTARFVDMGPDLVNPDSDECHRSEAEITTRAQSDLGEDQFALPPAVESTSKCSISNASDLSGTPSLDRESEILDLSRENAHRGQFLSSDRQITRTETLNSPSPLDPGSDLSKNPKSDEAEITAPAQSKTKMDPLTSSMGEGDTSEHSVSHTLDLSRTSCLDEESEILDLVHRNSKRVPVPPLDPQCNRTKKSDSRSPIGLKEAPTFQSYQTTTLSAETPNKSSSKCCWTSCLEHAEAASRNEDVASIQGELDVLSVQTENPSRIFRMDQVLHKPHNRDEMDSKGGSENAEATALIGLLKCGRLSSFPERGFYKEASDPSPPPLEIDYEESVAFCNRNLSAREQPEAKQAQNLKVTQGCCSTYKNPLLKGSEDKDNCKSPVTAEDGDLRNRPVFVSDRENSESEGHSTEPSRRELLEKQLLQTDIKLKSRMLCQNNDMTDHTVSGSGCTRDSVSEVDISHNASTSEISTLITRKMEGIASQTMSSGARERPNEAMTTFCFGVGSGGNQQKVATKAPKRQQPYLIPGETVKHLGSVLQLDENRRDEVQETPSGMIMPLKSFSGRNTTPTDPQSQVEEVVHNHVGTPSARDIPELLLCRVSVLKVAETSQPHIVGSTDGGLAVKGDETLCASAQNQQSHLIHCATVKHLDSDVGLFGNGRDKVEEIHHGVKIPLRGFSSKITTPAGPGPVGQVEGTVENHSGRSKFVRGTTSPKSIVEQSLHRGSLVKVGETRQADNPRGADGTILVEGDDYIRAIAQKHQQSHLVQCETVERGINVELIEEGQAKKVEEIHCQAIIPFQGFSTENTTSAVSQSSVENAAQNQTETDFVTGTAFAKMSRELSPGRASVLKVAETSQPYTAGSTAGALLVERGERVTTLAQSHLQADFIQCGTNVELIEGQDKKVEESHSGVRVPFREGSRENPTPTGPQGLVKDAVRRQTETDFFGGTASPKSIQKAAVSQSSVENAAQNQTETDFVTGTAFAKMSRELSPGRASVLKVAETSQPYTAGSTAGALLVERGERVTTLAQSHQQADFIQCGTNVELIEGQDKKVEESHSVVRVPFREGSRENPTPTGPQGLVKDAVRRQTETDFFGGTASPKSIQKNSPCRVSVLRVGQSSQPETVARGEKIASIARNHQQGRLIQCETIKHFMPRVELTEEGQKEEGKDTHCIVPARGFSRENTTPTEPQKVLEGAFWNQTETDFFIKSGSPESIPQLSPRRASVLMVGGTRQLGILEARSDCVPVPRSLDDKPKPVARSNGFNEVSSDVPHARIPQSPTEKCTQVGSPDIMDALGRPSNSNDRKDRNAKPAQSASTSQISPLEHFNCFLVASQLKSTADEHCLDRPSYRRCRFYILVTSEDAFFEETKACLEAAGHTAVRPDQFFLREERLPLLIIVKNEDISVHLSEIPHLLELKKSPDVLFAGIDEPYDLVHLTHQELFLGGGFVMFDRSSLESLSLDEMKRFLGVVRELNKTGKWTWLLHYRDSRRFKENARFSPEAEEKKRFFNWSQETGLCSVLPYHECDSKSRERPDYLACLVHWQVQNIAARFPVFVTDLPTVNDFDRNGIVTTTVNSFLMRFST
ncbi:uncharacterized protein tasor2 [Syngnathoides biaculeatus]|uniref:uncharacterized protein tasor2 n=1 Tax=Syngnathoides biaculeatus TaxID=300417 RepID=UPI002ADE311C|nr:uncharacterized protein tasor2 [Syngnathoides biaculeatus]